MDRLRLTLDSAAHAGGVMNVQRIRPGHEKLGQADFEEHLRQHFSPANNYPCHSEGDFTIRKATLQGQLPQRQLSIPHQSASVYRNSVPRSVPYVSRSLRHSDQCCLSLWCQVSIFLTPPTGCKPNLLTERSVVPGQRDMLTKARLIIFASRSRWVYLKPYCL